MFTDNGELAPELTERIEAAKAKRDGELWALTEREKLNLRARRRARAEVDAEDAAAGFAALPDLVILADALAADDEPERWRIENLLPEGANATLIAPEKAGKTVMANNLVRCLVDGEPFLGRYAITPLSGRVAILNYEVTARMSNRWLRQIDVRATDRVVALHLRGHRLELFTKDGVKWLATRLHDAEVEVLIVDPFGAAYRSAGGTNENDNTDVGRFLSALDEVKQRAGVGELIMPVHARRDMAEGAERARAASVLGDWPDAMWTLAVNKQGHRFLSARGRDVDVPEQRLQFDSSTKRLTIAGGSRAAERMRAVRPQVTEAVARHGTASYNKLETELVRDDGPLTRPELRTALDALVNEGSLRTFRGQGKRDAEMFSVAPADFAR